MELENLILLISNSIGNYGFPIVVTAYLLLRFEKKLVELTHNIHDLIDILKNGVKSNESRNIDEYGNKGSTRGP